MAISSDAAAPPRPRFFSLSAPHLRKMLGNLGWPILLKELRADFRRNRFFVVHFICVAAIAIGILLVIWFKRESENITSVQLGRSLFDWFFVLQYLIVLIMFPAVSATAFTEERVNKSLALLVTTDLKPGELVWGKFLATSIYCLITVLATVPLLAISALFGGVKVEDIALAYEILIGLTILIAMMGVFFSSLYRTSLPSILTVYGASGVFVYCSILQWLSLSEQREVEGGATLLGLFLRNWIGGEDGVRTGFVDALPVFLGIAVILGFAYAFLFVLTTNRLRSSTDDRTSSLRILAALLLIFVFGAFVLQGPPDGGSPSRDIPEIDSMLFRELLILFLLCFGGALLFATESPELSHRIRRRFARLRGPAFVFRVFTPGAFWGLVFIVFLLGLSTAFLYLRWETAVGWIPRAELEQLNQLDQETWEQTRNRFRELLLTFPFYLFAFAALGFYLANSGFNRGYGLLTVFFLFVITLLTPVIFQIKKLPDSIFTLYYLSPITLYSSLDREQDLMGEDAPEYELYGVPIILIARGVFLTLGLLFTTLGLYLARRQRFPLLRLRARERRPA